MEKLYVLAGKARSGKDSVASIIEECFNDKKVINYSCTMYLKKYIEMIYGSYTDQNKPRTKLQQLGQEIKEIYPNFFINRMKEDIKYLSKEVDIIIVSGIRLQKELDFLKNEFKGILIKVESNKDNGLTKKQKNDITEIDIDNYTKFDYIIKNDSDLDDLKKQVMQIIREEL